MDPKRFWDIIAAACQGDGGEPGWEEGLLRELSTLPPDDILAFVQRYDACVDAADSIDLWGAAYLINGGASDDGFYYFRCWLVGMGRRVYEAALADPDTLADVVKNGEIYELSLSGTMHEAWQTRTGRSDDDYFAALSQLAPLATEPPEQEDWDIEDHQQLRARFPRLSSIFLADAEG
jgi:hypothetical protein